MENKDYSLYKNDIKNIKPKIQNEYHYHFDKKENVEKIGKEELVKKINNIFKNPNYIYKADINIMFKDGAKNTSKVIGFKDNYLLCLDGKKIFIDDIYDIK